MPGAGLQIVVFDRNEGRRHCVSRAVVTEPSIRLVANDECIGRSSATVRWRRGRAQCTDTSYRNGKIGSYDMVHRPQPTGNHLG